MCRLLRLRPGQPAHDAHTRLLDRRIVRSVKKPSPAAVRNVEVVRTLWDAMRDRDVGAAMALVAPDPEWGPITGEPAMRGREAVEAYFGSFVNSGGLADAHALAFEPLGSDHVLLSGALRIRRPDNWVTTVQRWWLYRLRDGLIVRAESCQTRDEALAAIDR